MAAPRELPLAAPVARAAPPLSVGGRWLLGAYRASVVLIGVGLLYWAAEKSSAPGLEAVSLAQARLVFPAAQRLGAAAPHRASHPVLGQGGERLGTVLRTAPQTDDLIGYSGPSDLVIGLGPDGAVAEVRVLASQDTPAHVEQVTRSGLFLQQFRGWNAASAPPPKIDAVSGSTLTSLAMAEAVERRLAGAAASLRFPAAVTLAEARELFPTAEQLEPAAERPGWLRVRRGEQVLGYLVRTSPQADNIRGYGGPSEALAAVSAEGEQVLSVRLRKSYDTPEYVERVREDAGYWRLLAGRSAAEWAQLDFQQAGIEGVSGATQTSFAVAEGLRRRLAADEAARLSAAQSTDDWFSAWSVRPREVGLLALVLGGVWLCFLRQKGDGRLRLAWQIVLVAGFGLWFGDLLSLALLAGWSQSGLPWKTSPGLVLLAVIALVVPWGGRKQVYCHFLCPHGVLQEWLGRMRRWQVRLPEACIRGLSLLPGLLLAAAFLATVFTTQVNLAAWEPFDAWSLGAAAGVSAVIAAVGLVISIFVPQAYCRFGCPTGALLKLVQSHGGGERFALRDGAAGIVMLVAGLGLGSRLLEGLPPAALPSRETLPPPALAGSSLWGEWRVWLRRPRQDLPALQQRLIERLTALENAYAAERAGSETAQLSGSATTLELEFSPVFIGLLAEARTLAAATGGQFDFTHSPRDYQGLRIDPEINTVQKQFPGQVVDLRALLIGRAADELAAALRAAGVDEFLVEHAGSWVARGAWRTTRFPLENGAAGVTENGGVVVIAPSGQQAYGWATAAAAVSPAARDRLRGAAGPVVEIRLAMTADSGRAGPRRQRPE